MKTNKFVALLFAGLMTLATLTGCGGNSNVDDGTGKEWESLKNNDLVQIEFWGRDEGTEEVNYRNYINTFNSEHQNIVVSVHWDTDSQSYNSALDGKGNNLPDVFMLSNAMFTSYAASGKLANIRSHVDNAVLNDLYENAYEVYYFDHSSKKVGKTDSAALYGLPKDQGPYALCYNEDLLTKAANAYNATAAEKDKIDLGRVTDPKNPMTFSDFIDLGKKLKTQLKTGTEAEYVCSGYDMESAVYSNNANFFTDDSGRTAAIDSDNFVGAISFMQNLYKEGILPSAGTSSQNAENLFKQGRAIFFYAGPWKQKTYWKEIDVDTNAKRFTWNILPVLCGDAEGSVSTAYMGGMCYAISRICKYKDAALELVKYLSADSGSQRNQYRSGQCIPNLKSLAEEYATDSKGLIGGKNPINRGVWIDCVNGTSETDKITAKYRCASYTFTDTWQTNLVTDMRTGEYGSFWEAKDGQWVDVKAALTAYKPTMQEALDNDARRLDRM